MVCSWLLLVFSVLQVCNRDRDSHLCSSLLLGENISNFMNRQKKQFFIAFFDDAGKLLNSTKTWFIITSDLESVSKFDIPMSFGALNRSHSEEVCPFHSGSGCNVKTKEFRWKNTGQMHPRTDNIVNRYRTDGVHL